MKKEKFRLSFFLFSFHLSESVVQPLICLFHAFINLLKEVME